MMNRSPYINIRMLADVALISHFGLVALGFFKDQDDIKNSPRQTFQSEVRPGDIKYMDVNDDGVIDDYDKVAIGYPRTPEIMMGFGELCI